MIRKNLLKELIGEKIPRLWCPPLTFYKKNGDLDEKRLEAHWNFMIPNVKSFLVPGSTGDGWEMTDKQVDLILNLAINFSRQMDARILIGVLKKDITGMKNTIKRIINLFESESGQKNPVEILKENRACGFAVCPPAGKDLKQKEIYEGLEEILSMNLPIALYQLPQVTQNEMSPETVKKLAEKYENLIFLKDSSGSDRIALEDKGNSGVFMVRGAEGDYIEWLDESGGPYKGFLLSTANCFSEKLKLLINLLEKGRKKESKKISDKLSKIINEVFNLTKNLPEGNTFSNANRAIDHFMAYGPDAEKISPPRIFSGRSLPVNLIKKVGEILNRYDFSPEKGYLDKS